MLRQKKGGKSWRRQVNTCWPEEEIPIQGPTRSLLASIQRKESAWGTVWKEVDKAGTLCVAGIASSVGVWIWEGIDSLEGWWMIQTEKKAGCHPAFSYVF